MDRMLVVVFNNESDAYEGKRALVQLDNEGSISVYGNAVVTKSADGKVRPSKATTSLPSGPWSRLHLKV